MSETITREQLKKLIQEIIKEADDASRPLTNIQKAEEMITLMISQGSNPEDPAFKKYASDLKYNAKVADAAVIRGEIEKSISGQKRPDKRLDKYVDDNPEYKGPAPSNPPIPYSAEDWERWAKTDRTKEREKYNEPVGKVSPETRAKLSAAMKSYFVKKKQQPPV